MREAIGLRNIPENGVSATDGSSTNPTEAIAYLPLPGAKDWQPGVNDLISCNSGLLGGDDDDLGPYRGGKESN
jgi:hypothetical protein